MSLLNQSSIFATLAEACTAAGVSIPVKSTSPGRWSYTSVEGKKSGNGAGRVKVFSDGKGGIVWNWVTGEKVIDLVRRLGQEGITGRVPEAVGGTQSAFTQSPEGREATAHSRSTSRAVHLREGERRMVRGSRGSPLHQSETRHPCETYGRDSGS